jgi:hypothetical protein
MNNKTKLIEYTFDNSPGSIHEYEYRLFSQHSRIPVVPSKIIKEIIFCAQSGTVDEDDIENLLLDLSYSNVNVPVYYIKNPLRMNGKKVKFSLNEDDELISEKL